MLLSTTGSGQVTEKGSLEVGKLRAGSYGSWPQSSVYKWKNHFYDSEMKGDVGMSVLEKERKQEDAYTKTQTHS